MKPFRSIIPAIVASFVLIACGAESGQRPDQVDNTTEQRQGSPWISETVGPEEFKSHFNDENAVILDVRTDEEIAEGMIPGSIQIDYSQPDFKDNLLKLNMEQPVLVYCAAGGRSGKTKMLLTELGFYTVYDLDGGIGAWQAAGYEVETP